LFTVKIVNATEPLPNNESEEAMHTSLDITIVNSEVPFASDETDIVI
jgi:hypothetical protein